MLRLVPRTMKRHSSPQSATCMRRFGRRLIIPVSRRRQGVERMRPLPPLSRMRDLRTNPTSRDSGVGLGSSWELRRVGASTALHDRSRFVPAEQCQFPPQHCQPSLNAINMNACLACRKVKMKCCPSEPATSTCRRCARKSLTCVFQKHRRGRKPGTRYRGYCPSA